LSKWYQGKLEEALQMFRRANDLGNLVMGEAHTELASPRNNLGLVLRDLGQYDEAERNSREALALVMKGRGGKPAV
jgi:tetratricopeptide (TPR) repeat protein